jgi:hypothetical protein
MNAWKGCMLGAGLAALSSGAVAAAPALVMDDLNLRAGPGFEYGIITAMPAGIIVDAGNCAYGWCQVTFNGINGYADYNWLDFARATAPVVGPPAYWSSYRPYRPYPGYGYGPGYAYGYGGYGGYSYPAGYPAGYGYGQGYAYNPAYTYQPGYAPGPYASVYRTPGLVISKRDQHDQKNVAIARAEAAPGKVKHVASVKKAGTKKQIAAASEDTDFTHGPSTTGSTR